MMFLSRCLRLILRDVLTQSCLHQFLLEFVGTALFLSASLTAVLIRADLRSIAGLTNQSRPSEGPPHSGLVAVSPACPLQVVLVFGLSVAMAALSMGGAVHLNPAVSIAMVLTLRLTLWRAVLYMIGQLLGGVVSSALLLGLMGDVTPAVNQDGRLVLGAPGSFYFQGQVITVGVSDIINSGRSNEPVQYVTGIHQSDEQGGYDLYRDEAQRDSNVGLFYQVKIYDGRMRSSLRVHHTFMGVQVKSQGVPFCLDVYELNVDLRHLGLLQVASYFGHSVAVLLYLQKRQASFPSQPDQSLIGQSLYGRFGSALIVLGDLDMDGYQGN
ncbi:hypothetical protein XENOCAPTIV_004941 [Xenoophorus captivus]|uniref:Uncharacterized protein n=1 Tax=Xenoophorus captivus TaxID=1517983 RepID=A0ABV0RWZ4_9TELE